MHPVNFALLNTASVIEVCCCQGYGVQDMPSLYFALLNKASAVEECDASKAS